MNRRLMRLRITPRFLAGLLSTGRSFRVIRGIPSDAEVANVEVDGEDLAITIRSSRFSEVGEKARIPFLEPPVTIEVALELTGDAAKTGHD